MSYFNQVLTTFASEMTRPRRYYYSQQSLEQYLQNNQHIRCEQFKISNIRKENLDTILLGHKQLVEDSINKNQKKCGLKSHIKHNNFRQKNCVIYAHGMGSNKLEVLPLARHIKKTSHHFLAFDFSGAGKSDGQYLSYGLRESKDIQAVLEYLDKNYDYKHYVLWGRSMGTAAIILSQAEKVHPKVECLVLDSPYSSFQKVALQLASKKSYVPSFMLGMLVNPLSKIFQSQYDFNPFEIDLCKCISTLNLRVLLIYSEKDTVVDSSHSNLIQKACMHAPEVLKIIEDHNLIRSKAIYKRSLLFIDELLLKKNDRQTRGNSRGISVASKQSHSKGKASTKIRLSSTFSKPRPSSPEKQSAIGPCCWNSIPQNQNIKVQRFAEFRLESQKKRKIIPMSSLCLQRKIKDKENLPPAIGLMRKNRFK